MRSLPSRGDIAEGHIALGKPYLFVAVDPTSKLPAAHPVKKADRRTAREVLEAVLEAVPCTFHTTLTDRTICTPTVRETKAKNIQFADQPRNRGKACSRPMRFELICEANRIEHRLTKPNHPWSDEEQEPPRGGAIPRNSQDAPINRTIKTATAKCYQSDSNDPLRDHSADFRDAYNFARRLKCLGSLTPYGYI